ncbi:MAG TPA: hypothetical protein VFF73_30675 [Planctomycetota bacterium]|nr:hypothetical protein [Planctomycetota bacterium]
MPCGIGVGKLATWPKPVPRATWLMTDSAVVPFVAPVLSSSSLATFTPPNGGAPRPIVEEGGRIYVDVGLDEGGGRARNARLMLDTGTSVCALRSSILAGLDRSLHWYRVQGEPTELGGSGAEYAFMRKLPGLTVPGICRIENLGLMEFGFRECDGILAPSALQGRALVLDFPRDRLVFVPRAEVEPLLSRPGAVLVRGRRNAVDQLTIPITLAGKPIDAMVDTGAPRSFARSLSGVEAPGPGALPRGEVVRVAIGSLDVGEHLVLVHASYRETADLGMNVLQAIGRPVLFDLEGERLGLLAPE